MIKRIVSCAAVLALTFGGAQALPITGLFDTAVTARAEETLTYGDFEYYINADNKAVITNYIGSSSTVNIPSEINGKPVLLEELGKTVVFNEDILYSTFSSNIEIINVPADAITPHSVSVIFDIPCLKEINVISDDSKEYGFFSKDGVLFEKTVQTYYDSVINDWVTRDIIVLSFYPMAKEDLEYTIPSNITYINSSIINKSIKKLNISKNTSSTGVIYLNCPNLCEINVESDNPYLWSIDGVLYGIVYNKKSVISCPQKKKSVTIPNDIENIEWIAFANCDELTSIVIPDSVTSIGACAFSGCDNLKEVKIGDSVTEIGQEAFADCTSLREFKMPKYARTVQMTFQNCTSLEKVTLPDNLFNIGGDFYNCKKLKEIEIPQSVTRISSNSFLNCIELKKVTILGTETKIEKEAIGYYWDLNTYSYKKVNGLVIYCYPNSTAEKYAKENGFDYVLLKPSTTDLKTCTATLSKSSYTYTGSANKPTVTVKNGSTTLKSGTDYTVAYKNNTNAGTATVTITGKGSYTGTITKTFKITAASLSKATVSGLKNKYYTGKALTQAPVVKLGSKTLRSGTDYTVTYKNNKAVGKATVTITGKGNYTGTVSKTFKINPKKTTLKTATSPKTKQLKVTYSKVSGATGYQITYSTSSKFAKASTKSANSSKTSKTISKLTKGKTYYVKVRTYKTVKGTKYYSGYSAVKKVKVK